LETLEELYKLKTKESIDIALKYHGLLHQKNQDFILMYSGGMDSVSLAWSLLEHTDHNVHIHSIHLDNIEGRFKAEAQAIYQSINWLKDNQREFEFSSCLYSFKNKYPGGRDMALAMFQAGRVAATMSRMPTAVFSGDYNMSKEESAEAYSIFSALFMNKRTKPVWAAPFDYMNRVPLERSLGVYFAMPEQLRKLYWSCRKPKETPEGYLACGVCHACERQHAMKKAIKERSGES
jgi:7-cyano-7-deazaguanine synthase in queuosine biosynthesis|tara:strand:- start:845 stop:1549 length:705 start_codon:yes stop_codon:yes gene_type:complete